LLGEYSSIGAAHRKPDQTVDKGLKRNTRRIARVTPPMPSHSAVRVEKKPLHLPDEMRFKGRTKERLANVEPAMAEAIEE